jgi:hypothetical protein
VSTDKRPCLPTPYTTTSVLNRGRDNIDSNSHYSGVLLLSAAESGAALSPQVAGTVLGEPELVEAVTALGAAMEMRSETADRIAPLFSCRG